MVGVSRATAQWRYTLNKAPDCPAIGVHLNPRFQCLERKFFFVLVVMKLTKKKCLSNRREKQLVKLIWLVDSVKAGEFQF